MIHFFIQFTLWYSFFYLLLFFLFIIIFFKIHGYLILPVTQSSISYNGFNTASVTITFPILMNNCHQWALPIGDASCNCPRLQGKVMEVPRLSLRAQYWTAISRTVSFCSDLFQICTSYTTLRRPRELFSVIAVYWTCSVIIMTICCTTLYLHSW